MDFFMIFLINTKTKVNHFYMISFNDTFIKRDHYF